MHLRHIEPATRAGGPGNIDIRPERAFRRFPPPSPAGTCAERGRARARAHREVERWVERKRPTAQHNLSARKKNLHGEATGAEGRKPLPARGRGDRERKKNRAGRIRLQERHRRAGPPPRADAAASRAVARDGQILRPSAPLGPISQISQFLRGELRMHKKSWGDHGLERAPTPSRPFPTARATAAGQPRTTYKLSHRAVARRKLVPPWHNTCPPMQGQLRLTVSGDKYWSLRSCC